MDDRYQHHRQALAEVVGEDGIAVIPAAREVIRNHDVPHPFRQDTAFWYLTGFGEPDAVAVLAPGSDEGDYVLFVRPKDPDQEIWTGIRAGVEGAKEQFGADAACPLDEFDTVLGRMVMGREVLWYSMGDDGFDDRITGIVTKARALRERYGKTSPSAVRDVAVPLGELMLIKGEAELASLRRACEVTASGHREAMRYASPGLWEYQVQAALEFPWRVSGSPRNGYGSIVASGANACILHYESNDSRIEDDDLVLIDAACEIDGYSADITRTFPASGHFEGPGRDLYEVVAAAEAKGVEMAAPGATLGELHDAAVRVLTEGMIELGLLPLSLEESLEMHHYTHFYMHGTSHWLGLDVHDRGRYRMEGKWRSLEPGMTFTVEPGIYVTPDKGEIELTMFRYDIDQRNERRILLGRSAAEAIEAEEREGAEKITHQVPESLLGIGVRVEDDIAITEDGHENMTDSVPRRIDEVEAMCAEPSSLPHR